MTPFYKLALLTLCLVCCLRPAPADQALALSIADQQFAQGNFEQARKSYAAAEATLPADPAAHLGVVRSLLRLDRWEEAKTEAQSFAALCPGSADAHGILALALIRAGWQAPYADEAKKALALDPTNYWGLVASGRIADWNAKTDEARALFRRAFVLRPELPDALCDSFVLDDDDDHLQDQIAVAQAYVKLAPAGYPHEEVLEDAKDLLAHSSAYQAAFAADSPYQAQDAAKADADKPGVARSPDLSVEFLGDYAIFPVTINGRPFRLLFDTGGGDDILLSWNAARHLSLPVVAHSYVRGVSGKEKSDTLKAQTMTLAGRTYKSIKIVTADELADTGDGILGGDILRDSVVTLDFEKRTASLVQGAEAQTPPPLPGDKSVSMPFHFYHGDLYVQLAVNSVPVWALVDTGAYDTTLSLRFAKQQLKGLPKEGIFSGTDHGRHGVGNSDTKMEYIWSRDQSQITWSQTPPVSVPMDTIGTSDLDREVSHSSDCDFEVGLWLGMASMTYAHRLTFDYPHRLLTLEYTDSSAPPGSDHPKTKTK